ncbi:MAG: SIMPL domain-containing protein [Paludibacter sp.]
MKKLLILCMLVPVLTLAQNTVNDKQIVVAGYAEAEVEPDVVVLSMSQKETENLKDESNVVKAENDISAFLNAIGAGRECFTVDRYNVNSKINFISSRVKVNKSYKIVLKKINLMDTVVGKCMEVGMQNLYVAKTEYSKSDSLQNDLLIRATKAAKRKAETIAKTLNLNQIKLFNFLETNPNNGMGNFYSNSQLDEVAVVGYGTQAKSRTGSSLTLSKLFFSKTISARFEFQ